MQTLKMGQGPKAKKKIFRRWGKKTLLSKLWPNVSQLLFVTYCHHLAAFWPILFVLLQNTQQKLSIGPKAQKKIIGKSVNWTLLSKYYHFLSKKRIIEDFRGYSNPQRI